MAQANSNDSDTNDGSDISSQLSEMKENYERRINELHQEFSQLKDLMMAIVNKNNGESQPSSSKGPSKPAQQQGFDTVSFESITRVHLIVEVQAFMNNQSLKYVNIKALSDTSRFVFDHFIRLLV